MFGYLGALAIRCGPLRASAGRLCRGGRVCVEKSDRFWFFEATESERNSRFGCFIVLHLNAKTGVSHK